MCHAVCFVCNNRYNSNNNILVDNNRTNDFLISPNTNLFSVLHAYTHYSNTHTVWHTHIHTHIYTCSSSHTCTYMHTHYTHTHIQNKAFCQQYQRHHELVSQCLCSVMCPCSLMRALLEETVILHTSMIPIVSCLSKHFYLVYQIFQLLLGVECGYNNVVFSVV